MKTAESFSAKKTATITGISETRLKKFKGKKMKAKFTNEIWQLDATPASQYYKKGE
jgi:hypothetical protein